MSEPPPEEYRVNLSTNDLKTYLESLPKRYLKAICLQDPETEILIDSYWNKVDCLVDKYKTLQNLKTALSGQIERQEEVFRKKIQQVNDCIQRWGDFYGLEKDFLETLPTLYDKEGHPFKVFECKEDDNGNLYIRQEACLHWFCRYSRWCSYHQYMAERHNLYEPPICEHCSKFKYLELPVLSAHCPCEDHEDVPNYYID
jgi:hypothetical protein